VSATERVVHMTAWWSRPTALTGTGYGAGLSSLRDAMASVRL
jgi:hypothetical protein